MLPGLSFDENNIDNKNLIINDRAGTLLLRFAKIGFTRIMPKYALCTSICIGHFNKTNANFRSNLIKGR
jgi:hypothetical protein